MFTRDSIRPLLLPTAIIVGAVAIFSAGIVLAWTAPTQTAPNGNAAPPLDTTLTSQVKAGGLWAASVGSDSGYCIGASCITQWPVSQLTTAGTSVYYNTGNFGIGTTTPGTLLSIQNVANFSTATTTFYSTGGINLVGPGACFSVDGVCVGTSQWSQNGSHIHYSAGNVGVGISNPVTLLDVSGYARLAPQTSAPATCDASRKGSMAIANASSRICVCDGSAWIFSYNGGACSWDVTSGSQWYGTAGTYSFTIPAYNTLTVEVWGAGAGGTELSAGGNGGQSSWNGTLIAGGGNGGVGGVGGIGGIASGGDINLTGGNGGGRGAGNGGSSPNGGTGGVFASGSAGWPGVASGGGGAGEGGGGGAGAFLRKTYSAGAFSVGANITVVVGAQGAAAGAWGSGPGAVGGVWITWE
jgi:hypothetical protein